MTVTLFSWGYWGWGASTRKLVQAADAAEAVKGFRPPIFVDIRLRRQGRAKGFVGNAFRDLVGPSRYRWMQDLGNLAIATGSGGVQIKNPAAVVELVDLALQAADERRRVIFYCACEFPLNGALACHRCTVANLVLTHARKLGRSISVVEWPGGQPTIEGRIGVDRQVFSALMRTRKSIPFGSNRINDFAGLAWGSLATVECKEDGRSGTVAVGPARFATSKDGPGFWYLPVIEPQETDATRESLQQRAARWRQAHGLDERKSR